MSSNPFTHFGDVSIEEFVRDYWQKKPLLIRQALPGFTSPLSPDELAGLSLEEEIESRIVVEKGTTPWELQRGPFSEEHFAGLPSSHWTLLVQSVDQWVPEITALLDYFRFIPNWRLDDIMASYATSGGSVGPHFDQYDVFLIQGAGKRHWSIGQYCDQSTPCLEGTELHILKSFHETDSWVLEPGDMLYLPPQLAHYGKAEDDDCITYSVGFRAPSHADILSEYVDETLSTLTNNERYSDPDFVLSGNSGEISPVVIEQIKSILTAQLSDDARIQEWFGRYMTTPKNEMAPVMNMEAFEPSCIDDGDYIRNPQFRFAYATLGIEGMADLFIGGECYQVSLGLAELLSNNRVIPANQLRAFCECSTECALIGTLIESDILYIEGDSF